MDRELTLLPAHRACREATPVELFNLCRSLIEERDGKLNAFLTTVDSFAEAQALSLMYTCPDGRPVLRGVPVAIKDVLTTEHLPTTCASRILAGWVPPYTATCVRLLLGAGNLLLGKNNMDEFAMGSSGENSAFGPTLNPVAPDRVPGGSSSGSAAAVAAGMAYLALGSDTGGSVRQPAALCGVVGFKPSYGMVSRYGLIAYASSLDQVGVIARSVRDVALAMNTISRPDPMDSTCQADGTTDFVAALGDPPRKGRLGLIRELSSPDLIEEPVLRALGQAIELLRGLGYEIEEVSFPELRELALPSYYIISCAEASSNLARYDGIRYGPSVKARDLHELYLENRSRGFGEEVKRRILLGTWVLSAGYFEAYYDRARKVRALIAHRFRELFERYAFLLTPTAPELAFRLGEKKEDPIRMYASDICTVGANLAGLPALALPCGRERAEDGAELPASLQIIGPRFADHRVLALGEMFEQELSAPQPAV